MRLTNLLKLVLRRTYFVLLFMCMLQAVDAFQWLNVGHLAANLLKDKRVCRQIDGLSKPQVRICKRSVDHMPSVQIGARLAVHECQHQFRTRRWNCSALDDQDSAFGAVLKTGTRETAFVSAITAAGVAHSVTHDCSRGELTECGCDMSAREPAHEFQWYGCSDNVHYGNLFSKRFVDAYEKKKKEQNEARHLMNLHNNEAGRKILAQNMETKCKCHGVSGSCEMKTCWRQLPTFRKVGALIKDKFDGATEVQLVRDHSETRSALRPAHPTFKHQTDVDLVYLEPSPTFCEIDPQTGLGSTHGRECNRTSLGIEGCELMCCGRGYRRHTMLREERCNCKFHWCCEVRCTPCVREEEVSYCN